MNQQGEATRITCPSCGTGYRVNKTPEELARIRLKCKKCGHVFTPGSDDAKAPAAPTPAASPAAPAPAAPPAAPAAPAPPAAAAPPAEAASPPAPQSSEGDKDAFGRLEAQIGTINRDIYQVRKSSPDVVPDSVGTGVIALNDILVHAKREMSHLRRAEKDMETLLEVSNALNQEHELAPLLERIMDYAISTLSAERGFLMLKNQNTGALEVSVARGMGEDLAEGESKEFSTGIASRVAAENNPFFTANSKGDDRVAGFASVMKSDARAILCLPVNYKDNNLGTLYLDNRVGAAGFSQDLIPLANSFAGSGAIENAHLYENIREETQKRANLSRYLSPSVVEDILTQEEELVLGGSTVECPVLFTDVAGFTSFSENLKPDELITLLNEYFTLMADMIFMNGGTLDKFIGDATMAIFGAPVYDPHHAPMAVNAGLGMLRECKTLMEKWQAEGKPTFQMRVGVNSGPVVAGNLGSPQRMDYTVIGDTVNLAQRMESNSEIGGLMASQYTWDLIKDFAEGEDGGPIKVKGKSEDIHICRVKSITPPQRDADHVKRGAPRMDVELFAIYNQNDVTGTKQGIIRNLSAGGMALSSAFPAEAGNVFRLNCTFPPNGQVKDLPAKVIRTTWEEGPGGQKIT